LSVGGTAGDSSQATHRNAVSTAGPSPASHPTNATVGKANRNGKVFANHGSRTARPPIAPATPRMAMDHRTAADNRGGGGASTSIRTRATFTECSSGWESALYTVWSNIVRPALAWSR